MTVKRYWYISIPCLLVIYSYTWIATAVWIESGGYDRYLWESGAQVLRGMFDGSGQFTPDFYFTPMYFGFLLFRLVFMGSAYGVLAFISHDRGITVGKEFLWILVLVAGLFDVFLDIVPLVPTALLIPAVYFAGRGMDYGKSSSNEIFDSYERKYVRKY